MEGHSASADQAGPAKVGAEDGVKGGAVRQLRACHAGEFSRARRRMLAWRGFTLKAGSSSE